MSSIGKSYELFVMGFGSFLHQSWALNSTNFVHLRMNNQERKCDLNMMLKELLNHEAMQWKYCYNKTGFKTGSRICFKKFLFLMISMCVVYMPMCFFGVFFCQLYCCLFLLPFCHLFSRLYCRLFFLLFECFFKYAVQLTCFFEYEIQMTCFFEYAIQKSFWVLFWVRSTNDMLFWVC